MAKKERDEVIKKNDNFEKDINIIRNKLKKT